MNEKTILVAEDNPASRELLCEIVRALGYRVIEAADGLETVKRVKTDHPDLVLLDIQMPKMDGYQVVSKLRACGLSSLTFIAVTAFAMENDRDRVMAAGFCGYISKPISIAAVRDELRKCS